MSSTQEPGAVLDAVQVAPGVPKPPPRICKACRLLIPVTRLIAVPDAEFCVSCLNKLGDVPRIKRFDQYGPDGERVEVVFTNDKRLQRELERSNHRVPPDSAFNQAVGDDSHLSSAETPHAVTSAQPLRDVFVGDGEPYVM